MHLPFQTHILNLLDNERNPYDVCKQFKAEEEFFSYAKSVKEIGVFTI